MASMAWAKEPAPLAASANGLPIEPAFYVPRKVLLHVMVIALCKNVSPTNPWHSALLSSFPCAKHSGSPGITGNLGSPPLFRKLQLANKELWSLSPFCVRILTKNPMWYEIAFQIRSGGLERGINMFTQLVSGRVGIWTWLVKCPCLSSFHYPQWPTGLHRKLGRGQGGRNLLWIVLIWIPPKADFEMRIWTQGFIWGDPTMRGWGRETDRRKPVKGGSVHSLLWWATGVPSCRGTWGWPRIPLGVFSSEVHSCHLSLVECPCGGRHSWKPPSCPEHRLSRLLWLGDAPRQRDAGAWGRNPSMWMELPPEGAGDHRVGLRRYGLQVHLLHGQ